MKTRKPSRAYGNSLNKAKQQENWHLLGDFSKGSNILFKLIPPSVTGGLKQRRVLRAPLCPPPVPVPRGRGGASLDVVPAPLPELKPQRRARCSPDGGCAAASGRGYQQSPLARIVE